MVFPPKKRKNGKRRTWLHRLRKQERHRYVEFLVARDGVICQICFKSAMIFDKAYDHHEDYRTLDHIVSPNDGGSIDSLTNLRLAHQGCNNRRQNGHPK